MSRKQMLDPYPHLLSGILLLLGLVASVTRAAGAQDLSPAVPLTPSSASSAPLESYLAADGSLALPPAFAGSLDARGWALVSGEDEAPRFVRAIQTESSSSPAVSLVPNLAGDEPWETGFSPLGARYVYALVAGAGSDVYVGGEFTAAGDATANNIVKWDGTHWSALGNGVDDNVDSLAWDNAHGILYAGGLFQNICGNPDCTTGTRTNQIAGWNGTSWSPLSFGIYGSDVLALALDNQNDLYIGGKFSGLCTDANCTSTNTANNIVKWNRASSTWSSLSNGLNDSVNALALWSAASPVGNNVMVAGGSFTATGPFPIVSLNHLAYWDGSSWKSFWSGVDGPVLTLTVEPTSQTLVVGGGFNNVCQIGVAPPSCSNPTKVNHIAAAYANLLYWGPLGSGMDNWVRSLAIDNTTSELYAGGVFSGLCSTAACTATTPANGMAVVNYATLPWTWSALGSGVKGSVNAVARQGNSLYAGGDFQLAGGLPATGIAKWTSGNPGTWSALNSGNGVPSQTNAVAADSAGNVYVGGSFDAVGGVVANRIARWNVQSRTWSTLGSGLSGQVQSLAIDQEGTLFVGGNFTYLCLDQACNPGAKVNNLAKWTPGTGGTGTWSGVDNGIAGYVLAMAIDQEGNLFVGGFVTGRCPDQACATPTPVHGLLKWTRATATLAPFGASLPASADVRVMAVDSAGALYVAGNFPTVCADPTCSMALAPVNHIAKWTPSGSSGTWSSLDNGVNDTVYALAFDKSNRLYVAGGFQYTCPSASSCATAKLRLNRIGLWTPSGSSGTWSALHNGVSDFVRALAVDESNHLLLTGDFQTACLNESCTTTEMAVNKIAGWNGNSWSSLGSGLRTEWYGTSLAWHSGILSVGGDFQVAGGIASSSFARYLDSSIVNLPLVTR